MTHLIMESTLYPAIKSLHMACAVISICGFTVRGLLKLLDSNLLNQRWLKITPHIVDTILLACAVYLTTHIHQYPLTDGWLTAKLLGLLLYIGLGLVVMRFARTHQQRLLAFILALMCFAYITAVAITRNPTLGG